MFTRTRSSSRRARSSQLRFDTLETRIVPSSSLTRALDLPESATSDNSDAASGSIAVANNVVQGGLAGFPTGSDADFLVMSTGDATKAYAPRPSNYPHYGVDFGAKGAANDSQHLIVTVPIAAGVTHVKFDFDFMTDEVPGPANQYDDSFTVRATPIGGGSLETLVQLDVNDDLFLTSPPVNSIYARHTGVYVVDYRVPAGATAVQFDFYIADLPGSYNYPGYPDTKGDGTGDTAVAIDNFRFTSAKQIVWLNFDSGTLEYYDFGGLGRGDLFLPAFQPANIGSNADRTTLINSIRDGVAEKFAAYDIDFVLTQPASPPYGRIFIGGTEANTIALYPESDPRRLNRNPSISAIYGDGLMGLAEGQDVDHGNRTYSDFAFALAGKFATTAPYAGQPTADLQEHLETLIAHELGHTLGGPHLSNAFKDNIMTNFLPINLNATFEDIPRALGKPLPDDRTSLNVHAYLKGVLGSSIGSSFVNGTGLSSYFQVLRMLLPAHLFDAGVGVYRGASAGALEGSEDEAAKWFFFDELQAGENEIEIPNFGSETIISFFGSTVDGGPADFFSGIPTAGNMTYDEGFVPLYDLSGNLNPTLPAAEGTLGNLSVHAGGVGVSFSKFSSPGLTAIDPKLGFTFEDDNGDSVTVKLTSKTGIAAIELNDPDGDGKGSIARIELQGTSSKDKLSVKVKKGTGDGFVNIGSVSGPALSSFSAKNSDLTGTGLNFGEAVKSIELRDVKNGADILVGGSFSTKTQIKLHDVSDGTDISVDGQLKLSAARIGDGTIQAALLSKLSVKGDAKAVVPISGDFKSDVTIVPGKTLSAKEAKLSLLGSVSIAGRTQGATFVVPGNAGPFKTGSFENSSLLIGYTPTNAADPFGGGIFDGEFKLASFAANGFNGLVGPSFENSNLIAAKFGPISLDSVRTDNSANAGLDFGIAAKMGVAKNLPSIRVKTGAFTFDPTGLFPQSIEDFFVKVI